MTILLSDDEAVAIAASGGHRWPTVLPTVAVDEPREYAAALARGARSLRLRGMVGGESGEPVLAPELAVVGRAAQAGQLVVVAATRQGADAPVGGILVACPLGEGEVLLDLISPGGVHDITVAPVTVASSLVVEYLHDVFERGAVGDLEVSARLGGRTVRVGMDAVTIDDRQAVREWRLAISSIHELLTSALTATTRPSEQPET